MQIKRYLKWFFIVSTLLPLSDANSTENMFSNINGEDFEELTYSTQKQPIVNAAPFSLTVISLEPGEQVSTVSSGDPTRWSYALALSGPTKAKQAHILLKPNLPGLSTDLVITTNKRLYTFKLISNSRGYYTKNMSFRYSVPHINRRHTTNMLIHKTPSMLNSNYAIRSKWLSKMPTWKPVYVYDDDEHTYIEFPARTIHRDLPVLYAIDNNSPSIVNYHVKESTFVVDRVLHKAYLVLGVGHNQEKIYIVNKSYR